jgi:hypothetical protein
LPRARLRWTFSLASLLGCTNRTAVRPVPLSAGRPTSPITSTRRSHTTMRERRRTRLLRPSPRHTCTSPRPSTSRSGAWRRIASPRAARPRAGTSSFRREPVDALGGGRWGEKALRMQCAECAGDVRDRGRAGAPSMPHARYSAWGRLWRQPTSMSHITELAGVGVRTGTIGLLSLITFTIVLIR